MWGCAVEEREAIVIGPAVDYVGSALSAPLLNARISHGHVLYVCIYTYRVREREVCQKEDSGYYSRQALIHPYPEHSRMCLLLFLSPLVPTRLV